MVKGAYPRPNWWYGGSLDAFERAVKACPDTVFIGHAPGFWAHISDDDQYDKVSYPGGPVVPGGRVGRLFKTYPIYTPIYPLALVYEPYNATLILDGSS